MKPIFLTTALACSGVLAISTVSLADRGRGSIRAAGGPPARVDVHVEAPHPAPEEHHDVVVHAPPPRVDVHVEEQHAPPHVEVVHRDWDDNDEDARYWGGYAHGAPVRIFRGERIHDLPPRHIDVVFNRQHYFFDDVGAYYLLQPDGQYLVVQPPVGVIIPSLPSGVVPIVVGPTTYEYLDGVFYVPQGNTFAVVNPPPGIVVPTLPSGANQVVVNGTVVYQSQGFNYQPSLQDGVTVYTVTPS